MHIFYHSGFLSNLRLAEKQSCPEIFHCFEIFLSFRIFEQFALVPKTEFDLKFFKPGGGSSAAPPCTPMAGFLNLGCYHPRGAEINFRGFWARSHLSLLCLCSN